MREPSHLAADDETPSRLLSVADLCLGDSVSQTVSFTVAMRAAFAVLANDGARIHADGVYANARGYDGPILQGLCVTSRFSRLIGMYLPGESAVVESLAFKFRRPVYDGLPLDYRVEVVRIMAALRVARLKLTVHSKGQVCVDGEAQCVLR